MGNNSRDPWRTASILTAFIVEYNIVLALVQVAFTLVSGGKINPIDRVWDYREYHFRSIPGYKAALVQLVTASILIPIEVFQIQRARLVLDFSLTVQVVHLLLTCSYSGEIPTTWSWWLIWLMSSSIMIFGSEYACMQIELRPISFGATNTADTAMEPIQAGSAATTRVSLGGLPSRRTSGEDIEMEERNKLMEEGLSSENDKS
ncbi:Putative uncharacterized protein [Taphrina deformans PYCC 5710]|uniref:Integral membrane protein n=1 Tax=Taphrina deformans (strain PYCC 5710 / ATCC 11124 / CBS 356.35 / IMI 108563 / JCM 9778 / NBRC 8474) TaxID=1097556 RepID=R4X9J6_TAPDE|nr:Putative uncharacterized protein [Taphrina deformans PYCC 5710]|eukprot:CCG80904.1 Putative uncharacterized protein [Taphrina deformans PYCC 5710]